MVLSKAKNHLVPAASEIAREAGALLMGHFHRHVKVEYKGDVDLVTVADRESEALILKRIRARWPEHDVIGEEGSRVQSGSDYRWYVDPLDGTTNFAHGFPVFCVSLGLARDNEVIAGVVFDPTRNELFAAERGSGATLNGKKIRVSEVAALGEILSGTGLPNKKHPLKPHTY